MPGRADSNQAPVGLLLESFWMTMVSLDAFAGGPLAFESILWGIFTCLITFSGFLWIKDSAAVSHNRRRFLMVALCTTMYGMATAHWAVGFSWWRKTSTHNVEAYEELLQGLADENINSNATGTCQQTASYSVPSPYSVLNDKPSCAPSTLLMINAILSDAIVLFRACTIWGRHHIIRAISIVLFIALLAISGLNMYDTCVVNGFRGAARTGDPLPASRQACILCGIAGVSMVGISCLLNLWATCMIGYKAWAHKRIINNYLRSGNRRTRSEKMLALFVDSGALYTVLWAVVVVSEFEATVIGSYLLSAGLIQLVGMYPTVLVAATSWQRLQSTANEIYTVHAILTRNAQSSVQPPVHAVRMEARAPSDGYTESLDSIASVIELGAIRDTDGLKE